MQPWPLLGIAQLIVAMNDTLSQLGTAVRMQLPGYGWVVEGSVARLGASHAVHELDSKRTNRHTRKAILSCITHKQNIGQQQILQFQPQFLQRKEPREYRHGRQAGSVRFARSVAAAKHESAGGSGHTARAVVAGSVVAVNFSTACSGIVDV